MARKQTDFDATKTEHYRSYTVREHERKMYERVYKFVCIGCDLVVERKSYAVCCPSYGNECNGKTSVCRRGKKKGIISHETPLSGSTLTPLPEKLQPQVAPSKAKSKVKKKADDGAASLENRPYSGRHMMKRLKCGDRLLRIKRSQPDFKEWSQERDPDGVAWKYTKGQFVPLEVPKLDTSPVKEEPQPKPSSTKSKTKQKQKTTQKTKKASVTKAPSLESKPYSGRQMMKRLKCGDRLLRIKRSQPDFTEWSQERDPDGVAWKYTKGQFVPLELLKPDTSPDKAEPEPKPSSRTKSKTKQKQKTTQKTKKTSVAKAPALESKPFSGRQMMKRLKCGDRLLRIKRSQPDFTEWSQERDPDGVAWRYTKGQFVPLQVSQVDTLPDKAEPQPKPSSTKSKTKQKQKTTQKGKNTSVTKAPALESKPFSGRQMMKRLKCGDRLLRIKRDQPDFKEWSQQRDPNNIAWQYKNGEFFPLEVTKPEPKSSKKKPKPKPSSSKSKTKTKSKSKVKQSKETTQKSQKEPVQAVKTEEQSLSGRQMMKRLKCGDRLLRIRRDQPNFAEWSQQRDPDNVAWQYQGGQFVPVEVSTLDSEPAQVESPPKPSKSKTKTKSKTQQKQKAVQKKTTKKTKTKTSTPTTSLENRAYTVRQVMERFHCGDRLLRIKRSQPDFAEWSQQRDPDGIPWKYQKGRFFPQIG